MLVSGAVLGTLLGVLIGRSWQPLFEAEIKLFPVLIGSLLLRLVAPLAAGLAYFLYVVALGLTVIAAGANFRLAGAMLVAAGGALNLGVTLANGGMPVDPAAVATAGARMPSDALHVPLTSSSAFGAFADVIPVALVHNVYSAGDFAIAAGGFLVPFMLLSRR